MESTCTTRFNAHNISTAFHDAGGKDVVIFCHGYRSSSLGSKRFFVDVARMLSGRGISSLRFDQYGSGNSEGDFLDSSFNDWVATTRTITEHYLEGGFRVGLLGQSMGGATVLKVAASIPNLSVVVAWVPDPNVDEFVLPANGLIEEGGQVVKASFWQEAHQARIADTLSDIAAPTYIVQCQNDEYVSAQNHRAITENAMQGQEVEMYQGYSHSSWTYAQAQIVMAKSVDFIEASFNC